MSGGAASFLQASHSVEEYIRYAQDAQGSLWGYTDLGICNVESGNLNVREEASTSGKMVGKMSKDAACEILDEKDGWAHIKSGEVEGYVSMDYLLTGAEAKIKAEEIVRTVAIANVDGLNVRDDADTDSHVLTQVLIGEELEFVEDEGEWIKVTLDGEDAYVASEYVTVQETLGTAITMSELLYGQGVSDLRVDICEYAKQFVGNPYVWGGSSLTKGTDCSGFTMSVYKHFGISLSHSSRAQANEGKKISASELQPGDLVFYTNSSGTINHVALYIGGGQVCHASSPKTGIKINKYNYRTPVKYVRIIND
ncbi:MAG: C40 family peptidase [Acetatifactor sp.]|nr:C40 family peptidase [Acetatifactor sp.]